MQGLANIGNTCYINTFIQCIGHVTCLREWIVHHNHRGEFTKELQDVLRRMWKQQQSLLPRRFVHCVQSTFGFGVHEQHDINELLMLCFDKIAQDDNSDALCISDIACTDAKNDNIRKLCIMATDAWKKYHPKGFRQWSLFTEGLQVQQVQCQNCKTCFHNFDPFTTINIDLEDTDTVIHLSDRVFGHYFNTEQLDEWKCDHCKSTQLSEKVVRMWKMPRVFGVVLKRFRYCSKRGAYVKIRAPVSIPHVLEFGKKQVLSGDSCSYQLRSIALHHGSMGMGHYTCIGKVDDEWYHYDDMNVSKIADISDPLVSNEAYVLMYERT